MKPKRLSLLPSNLRDPLSRPVSPDMHRVPCRRYRFDARTRRLGLIDAHLDRQVSSTAARCPHPPAIPAHAQRPCTVRASCTVRRHHARASATMCTTSVPPMRPRQVGSNCRRPQSPRSSARASIAIIGPPRLPRRVTNGHTAKKTGLRRRGRGLQRLQPPPAVPRTVFDMLDVFWSGWLRRPQP